MGGITTTHESYNTTVKQWERCRDAVAGSDAIKARGPTYLPALSEQTTEEYNGYKTRAMWYGASGRTLQGLIGAVMRKEPTITVPSLLAPMIRDATQTGVSFTAMAKMLLSELLQIGRVGVLVDMPSATGEPARPYCVGYPAESIVNWHTSMIDGLVTLVRVVLCEPVTEEDPTDPYVLKTIEQYRELYLEKGDGKQTQYRYYQQLWRKQTDRQRGMEDWVRYQDAITPVRKGEPFDFIPFCFFGPSGLLPAIEKPPLLDLVDVNLSHYRSSADLEHGRHFCALPTPCVTGISDKTTKLQIGSSIAWMLPDPQAKAYMLEFTGQGLGALEKALEAKQQLMSVLGARLLEEQKKSVEASETLQTRYSGEQSVLRSVAGSVSAGLSKCLEWAALWSGVKEEAAAKAICQLNMDFVDAQMSFAELESLVRSWQSGAISYQTLYHLMEKGEITRPGITAKKEQAAIEVEQPAGIPQNIDPVTGLPDPERNPG